MSSSQQALNECSSPDHNTKSQAMFDNFSFGQTGGNHGVGSGGVGGNHGVGSGVGGVESGKQIPRSQLRHHHHPNNHTNSRKPFQMSYRRLLGIIFTVLTLVNIVSMLITTSLYLHRIETKEKTEAITTGSSKLTDPNNRNSYVDHHQPIRTNRDAYAVARFINFIALIIGISVRILGLIASGVCGKEFSDIEYETSDRRESFSASLTYVCAMIVLLAAYYVGIVRLMPHDAVIHCVLIVMGAGFVGFSLQQKDTYSKEIDII